MDYLCMADELDKKINPFRVLDHLDKSVDELESLLSVGEFDAIQRNRHEVIEQECISRFQQQLQELHKKREEIELSLKEREKLFKALLANISEVFWLASQDGTTLSYISDACLQVWGRSSEEFYRNPGLWLTSIREPDRARFLEAVHHQVTEKPDYSEIDLVIRHKDGEPRELRCRLFAISRRDGVVSAAGVIEDVTQYHLQDKELTQSISLLRATLDSTTDGILVLDREGDLVDYNSQFVDIWKIPATVTDSMDRDRLLQFIDLQVKETEPVTLDTEQLGNRVLEIKDGRYIECSLRPQQLNDITYGLLWCCRDITEQTKAQELIQYQASYDQLTKLPNRRLLEERLQLSLSRCKRYDRLGALLFLDLDNFKTINDTLGHPVGDNLLAEAANRLKSCLRQEDTAARLGGDEFVLLLTEFEADREQVSAQANSVAEKVIDNLSYPYEIEGHRLFVTTSIGITLFPESKNSDVAEVLKQADTAMYRAKEAGRNTYRFYFPNMQQATQKRLQLQNDLHSALADEQFFLYWHPLYDLAGKIVGA
ncbi:MAG: sensor domain-containing diguanylate cyclase, partial [Chromatiales bacterium]|nr:sensor domain-containing diguanylate cyclase [Chromatiales bacterium]